MNYTQLSDCFKRVIEVPGCEPVSNDSIKINNLAGISINSIESIRSEDYDSYIDVVSNLVNRSINRIINDMYRFIDVNLISYGGVHCIGRLVTDGNGNLVVATPPPASEMAGIILSVQQSKFLTLTIHNFVFHSPIAQTATFLIQEPQTYTTIETITVDLVAGENIIEVNRTFNPNNYNRSIVIVYDTSLVTSYVSESKPCYPDCKCNEYITCGGICACNNTLNHGTVLAINGFERVANTYGLSVNYSVDCSLGLFICNNINKFRNILSYAVQIEYYFELIGSSRLNKFTTTKASDYERIYEQAVKDYEAAYSSLSKNLDFCDDCCFKCGTGFIGGRYLVP